MLFHTIDTAVNNWMENKTDCIIQKVPKNDILNLLHFIMRLANNLIYVNNQITVSKREEL